MIKKILHSFVVGAFAFSQFGCATGSETTVLKMSDRPNISNQFWWPNMLDLAPLRQHSTESNPMGRNFDYAKEFRKLNLAQVKKDIEQVMKTSQDWWQ